MKDYKKNWKVRTKKMTERELQAMNDCVRIINNYLASEFEQEYAYTLNDLLAGENGNYIFSLNY